MVAHRNGNGQAGAPAGLPLVQARLAPGTPQFRRARIFVEQGSEVQKHEGQAFLQGPWLEFIPRGTWNGRPDWSADERFIKPEVLAVTFPAQVVVRIEWLDEEGA